MARVQDLSQFRDVPDPAANIDSKVKAAFTREYNKSGHLLPYDMQEKAKKTTSRGSGVGGSASLGQLPPSSPLFLWALPSHLPLVPVFVLEQLH